MALIKFSTPPTLAGFFFCLALTRCRAFILSCCNTAAYKRLHLPFRYSCNYTIQTQKSFTELYSGVSVDLLYSSIRNTADTQADYTPPAQRRKAYHQAQHLHRYQIPPPRRALYRSAQPPYYKIMYIKAQRCAPVMDPCQTVRHIADHASPAGSAPTVCGSLASSAPGAPAEGCSVSTCTGSDRRLAIWHRSAVQGGQPDTLHPAEQSSSERAEPLAATAASLFGLSPDN